MLYWKVFSFLILITVESSFTTGDNDFHYGLNNFMDAFEQYSKDEELNSSTTDESTSSENELFVEASTLAEDATTEKEVEPAEEEQVVSENVFQPGSDVEHKLTEEVRALAERAVLAISPTLRLVNVTKAISMVTNKVQRSLSLIVAAKDCEEDCLMQCRVELVSQDGVDEITWHNCLDSAASNEVLRDKRKAIGGFKEVDENEAQELAEIAVQTLDSIDADDNKREVKRVLQAQKQLMNGIMYHLKLEIALTDCKETEEDSCKEKVVDYIICKILMQRLFSGEAPHNAQVIKSECSPVSQAEAVENQKTRVKKDVREDGSEDNFIGDHETSTKKTKLRSRKMGGQVAQDPNSEKIKEISEFVLSELDKTTNSMNKQQIVRVVDARSQVVSGVKYFLKLELVETNCRKNSDQNDCSPTDGKVLQSCEVVVWEKPWLKFRTLTKANCAPVQTRNKRQVPGGKTPADPNDDRVKKMAEFAVSQLASSSNSLNSHKLLVVKEAQTQVVAGTNYFIKLQLVETNCKKGSEAGADCAALPDKAIQECDVVVWDRPWLNRTEMTNSNCFEVKKVTKRQLLGGKKPANPNDEKVKKMAEFAVSQLASSSNSPNSHKLLVVKEAQTQVVAGTNYFIKLQLVETNCKKGSEAGADCAALPDKAVQECDVVVWDRPWLNRTEMTNSNCFEVKKVAKRQVLGGKALADPNDDKVKEMAEFAVSQLASSSNSLNSHKLLLVKEAQTQVVAGTNYFIKLQLVETNCKKGSETGADCAALPDKAVQECDVVVWDQPWTKHREMTNSNCFDIKKAVKRGLVGGKHPADPNDDKVKEIAQFALSQLNARSNSINTQKLIVVKEAQTQVVAGTNYYLKLHMVETNCRKNSKSEGECSAIPDKDIQECDVVVYDRPWDKHKELTSVNCSAVKAVSKREVLVGGHAAQDKDSEDIQELAQFAVEDLNKKSNAMYKQILEEVVSAHTQVVAGTNYHLVLRTVESKCRKSDSVKSVGCSPKETAPSQECEITVWVRPWLNTKEVTKSVCKEAQEKQAVGGPKSIDSAAPKVLEVAKYILKTIDGASNSMYKRALIRVVDAKVQTVSGKKYFLTLEVGDSECTKRQDEENCNIKAENSLKERCNAVVWDRPWLGKMEVLEVNCGGRDKRSLLSRPSENEIHQSLFEEFKTKYNKNYASEEEHKKRFRIFRANLKKIQSLQENEQGTAVYGPNMFADLSELEFKKKYLGLKPGMPPKPSKHHMISAKIPNNELPTDFDWRDHNVVTSVKNQGQCGSCWAFSVTGNVEGQWALKHGQLLSLSEQELVDCDKSDSGCSGGYMTVAYEAIEKLGGLETEDEYPYDAQDETCKFNQSEVRVTVSSSVNITTNETEIAQWLYANGPISIGINANAMQFYMGGVSHPLKFLCSKSQLDHGVLLVGFGVHKTSIRHKLLPYWLIKNSWGPRWGEKGYYRVYRGDGTCGVNQMCSSAIVD